MPTPANLNLVKVDYMTSPMPLTLPPRQKRLEIEVGSRLSSQN